MAIMKKEIATLQADGLRESLNDAYLRIEKLQAFADSVGAPQLKSIVNSIKSIEAASAAYESYDVDWFEGSVFSQSLLRWFAQQLIEVCKPYHVIDTEFWVNYVKKDEAQ